MGVWWKVIVAWGLLCDSAGNDRVSRGSCFGTRHKSADAWAVVHSNVFFHLLCDDLVRTWYPSRFDRVTTMVVAEHT